MNDFHTLIAKSRVLQDILEVIDRAAKTESSVLITGESGVGKELFAEQVHLRSYRKDNPFIRVNCAAIPEGLLESEMFGHIKGAFTDAVSSRQGRFEMADGGTIFLDEIGDLPKVIQVKLLRVIQEKNFEKVGSNDTVNVNVRIVTATNKNLEEMIQNGNFREDLYYRLNVLPINIPPLRQRKDDIFELAEFFLKENIKKNRNHFSGFTERAIEALVSYDWPGNVRELQNCIERACIISRNKRIDTEDLFQKPVTVSAKEGNVKDFKKAVNDFKKDYIRDVLEDTDWNKTEAAKVLAIQRTYLSKLIKELKIKQDEGIRSYNAGRKKRN